MIQNQEAIGKYIFFHKKNAGSLVVKWLTIDNAFDAMLHYRENLVAPLEASQKNIFICNFYKS